MADSTEYTGEHRFPDLDSSIFIPGPVDPVSFEDMAPVFFVDNRPGWDEFYINLAQAVSLRGDCTRSQVGCVLVRADHTVAGIGYNGTYAGRPGCLLGACPRGRKTYRERAAGGDYSDCIATHAEHNAIFNSNAGDHGATAYVTREPCDDCLNLLVLNGVGRVVWPEGQWPQ